MHTRKLFIVILAVLLLWSFLAAVITHADETGTQATVISTNPQAQTLLKDCTPLSTSAYACVLTSTQADDLAGYANVVVLAHHSFLPSISR